LIGRIRLRKLSCSNSISGIRWLFRRDFVLVVAVGYFETVTWGTMMLEECSFDYLINMQI
jgi:hypothetical protein